MEAKLQQQAPQKAQTNKPNLTGIPTQMKLDFERRSGLSFDDVRVHYNSDKPAQLQALAYTQGTQVYVGPGQEGHVVQQKSRLITPTLTVHSYRINTDSKLEKEADLFAHSKEICHSTRHHSVIGDNDTIQAQFEITYARELGWAVTHVGRPNFSNAIDKISTDHSDLGSRNHFIPSKAISDTILATISAGLEGRDGLLTGKNSDNDKYGAESIKKVLTALCDLVAPEDILRIGNNNPFFVPDIAAKTRNEALQIVNRITDTFCNNPIDQYILCSYIDKLEFLLHNSYANLRMSDSSVNSAIKDYLDPPLIVQYSDKADVQHINPYWQKRAMVMDLTSEADSLLVKRYRHLHRLQNYYPLKSAIPKVAIQEPKRFLVSTDLVGDFQHLREDKKRGEKNEYLPEEQVKFVVLYKKSTGAKVRSLTFSSTGITKKKLKEGKKPLRIGEQKKKGKQEKKPKKSR